MNRHYSYSTLSMPRQSYCRKLNEYVNQTLVYRGIESANRGCVGYLFSRSHCSGYEKCNEPMCQARYPQKSNINFSDPIENKI